MKIEEITNDVEALKVSHQPEKEAQQPSADLLTQALNTAAPNAPQTQDGTTPSLPPGMAALRNKSADEILSDLNKSPLFMTELEENDELEAFKALAYEGTPLEVSTSFKERGNESFQEKRHSDAKEFYTKSITILLAEVRKRQRGEKTESSPEDIKQELGVLEASLVNRAACHLELKNYRSCIQDCGHALRLNPKNVKAYYRSSKALLALDRIPEADDSCSRGLTLDPTNPSLLSIAQSIITKNALLTEKKNREAEREQRRRLEEVSLKAALKARGIKTRKTAQPPEMEDAKIRLVPDPVDPTSSLQFPAVLLYPLALESDFIKGWGEMDTLGSHLEYILPVPWDKAGEYTKEGVECYMETIKGGLVKVGRKVTLLKVLSLGTVEVIDEVVKVFVLPKAKAEAWVADFKAKKQVDKNG